MSKGYLSEYFEGVAGKRLTPVEADVLRSNQHEFNGDKSLRQVLGEPKGKVHYPAKAIYLTDRDDQPIIEDTVFTWYDARQKSRVQRGVMRWEYRLYFPTTNVSLNAVEGDLLVIAKRRDSGLLVIVAESGSNIARQIEWLFGFSEIAGPSFSVKLELETEKDRVDFAARVVLESIGVEVETIQEIFLEEMLKSFDGRFPTTRDFSAYARSTLKEVNPGDDADEVLMAWMDREEVLFRTLERHLIKDRLSLGFGGGDIKIDVDGFLAFSLSVQNRRKSRVGYAFEHHLEQVFCARGIRFSRNKVTENKSKPDFLFPGHHEYRDLGFDSVNLTMLGVKSTCKDRWRQVLAEADRIEGKHLLTLEAPISVSQTDEMRAKRLQLVVPKALHKSYSATQKDWLMSILEFTELVRARQ